MFIMQTMNTSNHLNVQWLGHGIDHPRPSSAKSVNKYTCSYTCTLPLCLHGILYGELGFYFT